MKTTTVVDSDIGDRSKKERGVSRGKKKKKRKRTLSTICSDKGCFSRNLSKKNRDGGGTSAGQIFKKKGLEGETRLKLELKK